MANYYWIKLYIEILDDPKMGRLTEHQWNYAIKLFLLAGEMNQDGLLPTVEDMAWRMRCTVEELETDLADLAAINITQKTKTGWIVTNFAKRQDRISDADRMKAYRDRKQKTLYYGNDNVTIRNADTDTESDTESDIDKDKEPPVNIFKIYEQNIGIITPMISEKLKDAEKEYPAEWIREAFDIAVKNNARKLSYVLAILNRWKVDGFKVDKRSGGGPEKQYAEVY